MSLEIIKGDLLASNESAIAHGCNVVGVMGAGIARQIAERYPMVYSFYKNECDEKRFKVGMSQAVNVTAYNRWVFNLATQDNPGPCARYEWVERSVAHMLNQARAVGVRRIAIPKIGCGIGGLDWNNVEPLIEKQVQSHADFGLTVVVYVL